MAPRTPEPKLPVARPMRRDMRRHHAFLRGAATTSASSGIGWWAPLSGGARLRAAQPDDDAALELHVSLEAHTEHRADAVCIDGDAPQDVRCGHRDVVVSDDDELLQLREPAQQAGEAHHIAVVERSVN